MSRNSNERPVASVEISDFKKMNRPPNQHVPGSMETANTAAPARLDVLTFDRKINRASGPLEFFLPNLILRQPSAT